MAIEEELRTEIDNLEAKNKKLKEEGVKMHHEIIRLRVKSANLFGIVGSESRKLKTLKEKVEKLDSRVTSYGTTLNSKEVLKLIEEMM